MSGTDGKTNGGTIRDERTKVAIIGSGNIGTDLMIKVMRNARHLQMGVMVGIDPASDGLARASRLGVETTHEGVDGLLRSPQIDEIGIVFDATSAAAHRRNHDALSALGIRMVDLTPAAIGPYVIPAVNLEEHLDAPNVNMVTCGGQATIPIVAAISRVVPVVYAEIVASIASKSAGSRHSRQHRRVHRDHLGGDREGRWRPQRQGHHHSQPGRATPHDARHCIRTGGATPR